jgi:cytoskeletal protein CcmA (bactofilin family)
VFSHGNASQVVVGSYVEIQGNVVGDTLVAKKVELKSGTAASGMAFEQSGTVSNFVSLSNFKLGGLTVNAATAKLESKTGSTIANGTYIEVTGKLDANNVFVATKVELK